jgi:hypothetical protein
VNDRTLFFESEAEAIAAAHALEKLGGRAKKLLAECIEHQSITRKSTSAAARALENEGFLFITESDDVFDKSVEMKLIPTIKNGQIKKRGIDKTGLQIQPGLGSHWLSVA